MKGKKFLAIILFIIAILLSGCLEQAVDTGATQAENGGQGESDPEPEPEPELQVENDLSISGELVIAGSWSDETSLPACFMTQYVYLDFYNGFDENKKGISFEAYVDDELASTGTILTEEDSGFGRTMYPGKNRVHFDVDRILSGHTLKIVIDTYEEVDEANENNNEFVKIFPETKIDLKAEFVEYDTIFKGIIVKISRDKITPDCPSLDSKDRQLASIYIDGEKAERLVGWGFNDRGELTGDVLAPFTEPGEYSVRVVVDPNNVFDESNEENNEFTGTVVVP